MTHLKTHLKTWALWVFAIAASVLAVLVPMQPSSAAGCPDGYCSNITHYSPDDGLDTAFQVECKAWTSGGGSYTYQFLIAEGNDGRAYGCPDVQRIYVRNGEEIHCFDGGGGWPNTWDATGWYNVGSYFNPAASVLCVMQSD